MNEDQFNKFFQNKLSKYPSQVPDDMWERIQGKKKKRFFFWWLFMGILLASLATGYFVMQTNTNKQDKENNTSLVKQERGAENKKDTASISSAGKKGLPQPAIEKKEISETGAKNSSDSPITTTPGVITKDVYAKEKQHKNDDTQNLYNRSSEHYHAKKNKLPQKQKLHTMIANAAMQDDTTNDTDTSTIDNKGNQKTIDKNDSIAKVNIAKPFPLAKDSSKKNIAQKDTSAQKNKKATHKTGIFLTASFSTGIPINTFTSNNAYYTVAYLKSIYKIKSFYSAAAGIGKTFGRKFSAHAGLLYSQINIKLQTLDSANLEIKGTYSNIDIPLIVGYNIGHGSFTTTIHTGIIYNLSASGKGSVVYDSTGINTVDVYKKNTGISLYFGFGFAHRLNNKMNLFAEPYFIYRPSYITTIQSPFKQQINVAGISFGLKYDF